MTAERRRLLVLTSTYPRWTGDTEPGFVHELCRRLVDTFDVTVLTSHAPGSKAREILEGVTVIRFRYAPAGLEQLVYGGGILSNLRFRPWTFLLVPGYLIASLLSTVKLLRGQRFDVIHAHWLVPQGIVGAVARNWLRYRVPLVTTSHGGDLYSLRGRMGTYAKRFALQRSKSVTVVSRAMRESAEKIAGQLQDVRVIPMGVDLQQLFTPDENIARNACHLLFVGRLVEKKGLPVLLEACKRLRLQYPELRLEIVGEGPCRREIEKRIMELDLADVVIMTGALEQASLPDRLRKASCLVMPSIETDSGDQEGFGLVQVEAMGCLCPVVSSDLPAVRDVVIDNETGLLVPPGDPDSLAIALSRLLADDQLGIELAKRARARALSLFDWSATAQRYAELLQESC